MSPRKVLRRFMFVMVTKFVMMTSSFGIIMSARNPMKRSDLPLKSSLANAYAAKTITSIMRAVVMSVKINVLRKYLASGTCVNALI